MQRIHARLSLLAPLFGHSADTEARITEKHLDGDGRLGKRLAIGIAYGERHVADALLVHIAHRVTPATANAYDLYYPFRHIDGVAEIYYSVSCTIHV